MCLFDRFHTARAKSALKRGVIVGLPVQLNLLDANFFRSTLGLAALVVTAAASRADPVISEIMAANSTSLADEDGAYPDWIEIHNPDSAEVDLTGWFLSDTAGDRKKWQFPALRLPAGGYLVVFASNKNRRDPAARLHTNFALSAKGEYLALVKPDGVTVASEFAPAFPEQDDNVTYGLPATPQGFGAPDFLRVATPGRPNSGAMSLTLSETVRYSRPAGPFRDAFTVQLYGASGDQKIRYVVAPSGVAHSAAEPSAVSPEYSSPLRIDQSVLVRAAVFSADGSARGPVTEAYYPRLGASLSSFSSALPVFVIDSWGAGTLAKDGIDHPSWMFGYDAPGVAQPTFTAAPDLVSRLTTTVRGTSSAEFPKKGYNVKFTDDAAKKREQSLFDFPAHEKWALVGPWAYNLTYINNPFVYTLSNQMGRWAPRTRIVELFFNGNGGDVDAGDYAGIYVVTDRVEFSPERVALDSNPAPNSARADTGSYLIKIDTCDADQIGWVTRRNIPDNGTSSIVLVAPKADEVTPAQLDYIQSYVQRMEDALAADHATGFSQRTYLDYVDRDSWVDHHLLNTFVCNPDALSRSAYFTKPKDGKLQAGPVWDFDRALASARDNRSWRFYVWSGFGATDVWNSGWWGMLARDPEFMQDWIDRWQALRRDILDNRRLLELIDSLAQQVGDAAASRDAARWTENASPLGNFSGEITKLKVFVQDRARWIDLQFASAPLVSVSGGMVTFTPVEGAQLVYTVDGSDPRALGGAVGVTALTTTTPLTVAALANVHVRSYRADLRDIFPGSPWSSAVGTAAASPLRPRARIVNLSSRAIVGTGQEALIAGVVVADTAAKRYLSRAIGPGLAAFGATGFVADPQLSILGGNGVELFRNDGWESGREAALLPAVTQAVGAFPLSAGSRDAALANELPAGSYTIQITSSGNRPGVGLAEFYELEGNGRTINLSTRARVRDGDGVLIGGFVVQGPAHQRMLIRAVGPTLATFGVTDALRDPVLTVFSGQEAVAANDRWESAANARAVVTAAQGAGAFTLAANSEDAALLATLPPGAYTVEVRGKAGAEGIALLEFYEIP